MNWNKNILDNFRFLKIKLCFSYKRSLNLLSTNTLWVIFFHFQASVDGQCWSLLHHSDIAVKTYLLSHLSSVSTKNTLATMKKYKHIECFQKVWYFSKLLKWIKLLSLVIIEMFWKDLKIQVRNCDILSKTENVVK